MTVPVGASGPLFCLTVAVSVTGEFSVIVDEEAISVAVVLTTFALTLTETAADVEPLKLDAPEYTAVMELDPIGSEEVVNVADPAESVAVPSIVAPL